MLTRVNQIGSLRAGHTTQKVVVVNGDSDMLELLESVLDAGHYDIVFVAETEHAYAQIKRVRPNLIILCVGMNDAVGLHVLSMLKLDEETSRIPVLTYTGEADGEETDREPDDDNPEDELPLVVRRPQISMN
ncbi:MAG: Phosphate regulon transcriptional regulatory protein PhoB [Acidobacteria bacterium]|nr:Phosphate regulon transcriptional regulatory protein PhoB [Acidobacteriota bacterium]